MAVTTWYASGVLGSRRRDSDEPVARAEAADAEPRHSAGRRSLTHVVALLAMPIAALVVIAWLAVTVWLIVKTPPLQTHCSDPKTSSQCFR